MELVYQLRPRRAYAAFGRVFPGSGARLKRSLNGFRRRLSVSCVGLWRGLIARNTFGLAIRTLAANSLTPIARITFPSASCRSIDRNSAIDPLLNAGTCAESLPIESSPYRGSHPAA